MGYYFYKTSVDETADWKVYQDEEHGFEMKYPRDLRYKKISVSTIEFAYPEPPIALGRPRGVRVLPPEQASEAVRVTETPHIFGRALGSPIPVPR